MSNLFRPVSPASSSFLPEDYVARKTETRVNIMILALFALVLGGVFAACVVTTRRWHELKFRQDSVNAQYEVAGQKMKELQELQKQRAQILDKAEITAALVERVPRWAVLGEISLRMPPSMRLDTLNIKSTRSEPQAVAPPTAGTKAAPMVKNLADKITGNAPVVERPKVSAPKFSYALTIVGSATKNSDVADFLASLKSSPVMDNLELTYIREAKEKDRELRKFEIGATLRTNADSQVLSDSLRKLVADRTAMLTGGGKGDALAGPPVPSTTPTQTNPVTADGTPKGQE